MDGREQQSKAWAGRELAIRVAFYGVVGGFADALLAMTGASGASLWLPLPILAAAVMTTSGEILFSSIGLQLASGRLIGALVVGSALSSIAMLVPTMLLGWSAEDAFLGWSALVLVGALATRGWRSVLPTASALELVAALAMAALVIFFARHQIVALQTLNDTLRVDAWIDYLVHGTVIASFGDPLALHAGDMMLTGAPRVFYHYAPFMLPAALSQVTGLSGFGLATAVLLPLGLFIGLLGLYVVAAELCGQLYGFLAVLITIALPDASHYGLRNGFFGFEWLVFTAPGSAYAIGLAAVGWAVMLRGFREKRAGLLLISAILGFLLILVRAHMFLLFLPALAGTMALLFLRPALRPWVVSGSLLVGLVLTALLLAGDLGAYISGLTRPVEYLHLIYQFGPDFIVAHLQSTIAYIGAVPGTMIGGLLLLPAALGGWAVALPVVAAAQARARCFTCEDYFPILLCLTYLALVFWAPVASNGLLDEYKHRHFVLLYAFVALWTLAGLLSLTGISRRFPQRGDATAAAVMIVLTAALCLGASRVEPSRPSHISGMAWARSFYGITIDPGMPAAASFLHRYSIPGDLVAVGGKGAQNALWGPAVEVAGLADMPIYVGRTEQNGSTRGPTISAMVTERMAEVASVDTGSSHATAMAILRSHGVRWYVMVSPDVPKWDPSGSQSTFRAGSVLVYDSRGPDLTLGNSTQ